LTQQLAPMLLKLSLQRMQMMNRMMLRDSRKQTLSNISSVATCGDDRTASQQEPNSRLLVPVADVNTVAGAGPSPQNPVSESVPVLQDPVADLNAADRYST
ncbi:hypothetical protein M9458_056663, partial [Cirrhinus mrigala]